MLLYTSTRGNCFYIDNISCTNMFIKDYIRQYFMGVRNKEKIKASSSSRLKLEESIRF